MFFEIRTIVPKYFYKNYSPVRFLKKEPLRPRRGDPRCSGIRASFNAIYKHATSLSIISWQNGDSDWPGLI